MLRVIAGEKGGHRLVAPAGRRTRPTTDRAREAVFSMLESLLAPRGGLSGLVVWDLFAGSGALGIEALSRGASSVTFVDRSRLAVAVVRSNLARLGYGPSRAEVVQCEVLRWACGGSRRGQPDIVFADPPYDWLGWPGLLGALAPCGPLVVMESGEEPPLGGGWRAVRARRYGGTLITLAARDDSSWGRLPGQAGTAQDGGRQRALGQVEGC